MSLQAPFDTRIAQSTPRKQSNLEFSSSPFSRALFKATPYQSRNDSSVSVRSDATSIFERDVETENMYNLSNNSYEKVSTHLMTEDLIPSCLNASVEALNSESDLKDVEIISTNSNKVSDNLSNFFAKRCNTTPMKARTFSRRNSTFSFASPSNKNRASLEDLVRTNKSSISFCSYSDFLEDEKAESKAINSALLTPARTRTSSISQVLMRHASVSSHSAPISIGSPNALSAAAPIHRSSPFKKYSLGDAFAAPEYPKYSHTPVASPIRLELVNGSAVSASLDEDDVLDFKDPIYATLQEDESEEVEFENALDSVMNNGKSLTVCSLQEQLNSNAQLLAGQ